jgi:ABC-type multidrug transport system ATPase subunit
MTVLGTTLKYCIECDNLNVAIPASKKNLKANLGLTYGEFYLIAGSANSGKTLLFDAISGQEKNYSGSIKLLDKELALLSFDEVLSLKRQVGFFHQTAPILSHLNAYDQIEYVLELKGHNQEASRGYAQELLVWLGLNSDQLKGCFVKDLSKKNQVKLQLAQAIIKQPKVLILDDPLEKLDASDRLEFLLYLKELFKAGMTVILFTRHQSVSRAFATSVLHLEQETLFYEVAYASRASSF